MTVKNKIDINTRIDCILIWGHGLPYINEIIDDIRIHNDFNIIKIVKHQPKSIKKLVREIYSFDYAPFWHLKSKTKYLLDTPREVCFIFIENLFPDEDYVDNLNFRHKESLNLKRFKETIRNKFNPKDKIDNSITHYHIIHATDSQEQTHAILKYLGWKDGINTLTKKNQIFGIPNYVDFKDEFNFIEVEISNLYCRIITGESWNNFKVIIKKVIESPQYLGLSKDIKIYEDYINKYIGGPLKEDYSATKFLAYSRDFVYLSPPYDRSYVIVEKVDGKLIILDGLHRASLQLNKDINKMIVCQIKTK